MEQGADPAAEERTQFLARQMARRGAAVLVDGKEEPELWDGLYLFYGAFIDLTHDRAIGFGEGPIPWSSIVRYAEVYAFGPEQREDLIYLVRKMDAAYLKFRADHAKDD